jgi:hypothetical protein
VTGQGGSYAISAGVFGQRQPDEVRRGVAGLGQAGQGSTGDGLASPWLSRLSRQAGPRADSSPARRGQGFVPLGVGDIRDRGCAAAGVRLAGEALSGICRLDLYGAWRLLTVLRHRIDAYCSSSPSTPARPVPTACCTQRSASTNPKSPGPSHRAATPTGSRPSIQISPSNSSVACEILAARCPPAPGHPLSGVADLRSTSTTPKRPTTCSPRVADTKAYRVALTGRSE